MKNKTLKNSLLVLSSIVLLASCGNGGSGGGDTPKDDELWICAYNGGYGDAWLESMTKEFEAKTGIKVVYRTDTSLLDKLENDLKKPKSMNMAIRPSGIVLWMARPKSLRWKSMANPIITNPAGPKARVDLSITPRCSKKMDGPFLRPTMNWSPFAKRSMMPN